ncbi:MAG: carbonic anhydrase [Candidatus Hatepunaea meridiana]|nr:carbonic anhydrase [Candidatus Hatepunaea meridiana]
MPIADKELKRLTEGNERFAEGKSEHPNLGEELRHETFHSGQEPFVAILSCADSRAPVELVFDQGIGDVFSVRNAGNIYDDIELGSLELGVYKFNIPLLIVMGHTDCGAIKLGVQGDRLHGYMTKVIDHIIPVAEAVKRRHPDLSGEALETEVTKSNALRVVEEIIEHSEVFRKKIIDGELKIIAAMHDLKSGKVSWLV